MSLLLGLDAVLDYKGFSGPYTELVQKGIVWLLGMDTTFISKESVLRIRAIYFIY